MRVPNVFAASLTFAIYLMSGAANATPPVPQVIHIHAAEIGKFASSGLELPKAFVLDVNGNILLDGKVDLPAKDVLSAARSANSKPAIHNSTPGITSVLIDHALPPPYSAPVIVMFSASESWHKCIGCDAYNDKLLEAAEGSATNANWVHVILEKNDYKP